MAPESEAIKLHRRLRGKIETKVKINSASNGILKLVYTPGVADVSREIAKYPRESFNLTGRWNSIAIISDGTRVLGLGDIGPEAAMPVMEGKAILYKQFGGVDAHPICLATKDADEIVKIAKALEPNFGGINIEDIEVPKCLSIVERLQKEMKIPVFHDDQHGTAVVVLAALLNALKVVGKSIKDSKIVIAGSGSAGYGVTNLLVEAGARDIIIVDSSGSLWSGRRQNMNHYKEMLAGKTNKKRIICNLKDALAGADAFIGVSGKGGLLKGEWIGGMARDPIVFAISNPDPEIMPKEAKRFGAKIVATGRSDFPNQVNNQLVFPGFMRGVLDCGVMHIDQKLLHKVAAALAEHVKSPRADKIIPTAFDRKVYKVVADAAGGCKLKVQL
ncbi:MAG: NADP-dependent malic enzyme [Candidatus Aenigmarchaeota archaeon]|nr:NADP-dependent malic enzyme [Candidatus Aenigmarchaeota archaeon]